MHLRNVRFVLPVPLIAATSLTLGGCGSAQPDEVTPPGASAPSVAVRELDQHALLLDSSDPTELALTVSQTVYARAETVVLADADDDDAMTLASAAAVAIGAPALLARGGSADGGLADELDRLGARVAVVAGDADDARAAATAAGVPVIEADDDVVAPSPSASPGESGEGSELGDDAYPSLDQADEADLVARVDDVLGGPASEGAASLLQEVLAVVDPEPGQEAAIASLRAAGAVTAEVPHGDLGASKAVTTLDAAQALTVIGVGPSFGEPEDFGWRVAAAERAALLPTGTQHLLPARYVTTTARSWDDPATVVARAEATAAAYTTDGTAAGDTGAGVVPTVVPTLVVTAGVSSSVPGDDGDGVAEEPVEELRPLVDAARDAGLYVLLDIGAGSSSLVTEVQDLEPLLRDPGVGVSVHPEGRWGDGTTATGAVPAAEVQDVVDYLAGLAVREGLPETMLVVHQTRPESVTDRDRLASVPQVTVVLAADRTGGSTTGEWVWDHVSADVPDEVGLGWAGLASPVAGASAGVPSEPAAPVLVAGP